MEVLFLSYNREDLQLLGSKFCSFSAISLLFRTAGQSDGRLEKTILRLTQASLAGTVAELGKRKSAPQGGGGGVGIILFS